MKLWLVHTSHKMFSLNSKWLHQIAVLMVNIELLLQSYVIREQLLKPKYPESFEQQDAVLFDMMKATAIGGSTEQITISVKLLFDLLFLVHLFVHLFVGG